MKRLLEFLLAILLFLVPISYTNSTYNPVIIKAVVFQGLLLLVFLLFLFLNIRAFSSTTILEKVPSFLTRFTSQNIIFLPILFYLMISMISLIPSHYKYAGMREASNLIAYIFFFFATFYILNKNNIQKVLTVWSISTLLAAVIGILDFRHRRVASVGFGNPNLLAGYMVIALPVITGLLLASVSKASTFTFHRTFVCPCVSNFTQFLRSLVRPKNWRTPCPLTQKMPLQGKCACLLKFLYIISIISILFVLYLCKSRGAWLALAGGALTFLILLTMNNKKRLIILILSIAVIGTIIFSLFLVPIAEELILDVRPFIWRGTVKMIKAHPFIGVGYGTYLINYPDYRSKEYFFYSYTLGKERGWQAQDVTDHAHSEYLEIAAETGLAGLTAFFSIIIIFFMLVIGSLRDIKGSKERFILIGLASGVVSVLIDNTVNISMRCVSSSLFFWFSMAASLTIISGKPKSPSPIPSPADGEGKGEGVTHPSRPLPLWERIKVRGGLFIVIFLLGLIFYKTTYIDFRASAYLMKGIKSRFNREWQTAINHYKKAVSIDPYLLTAYYRLAYAYNEVGDLDKAIGTYKEILQIVPHYAKTEANIGKVYIEKDMPDEALLYFKKAETLNPYDIDLLCSIGSLYMKLGDLDNAKCYVRRALTIEPGNEYASSVMRKLK